MSWQHSRQDLLADRPGKGSTAPWNAVISSRHRKGRAMNERIMWVGCPALLAACLMLGATGCTDSEKDRKADNSVKKDKDKDKDKGKKEEHAESGPHKGVLVEW